MFDLMYWFQVNLLSSVTPKYLAVGSDKRYRYIFHQNRQAESASKYPKLKNTTDKNSKARLIPKYILYTINNVNNVYPNHQQTLLF